MFSVVIPLFNKRPYIRRAVESVLGQTRTPAEVLVIDDGSTDGGGDEISTLGGARVRVIRQPNAGEGAARNRGTADAHSEWVAFLDADDMWLPEHLMELEAVIRCSPRASLVSASSMEVRSSNTAPPSVGHALRREIDYFAEAARFIGVINASSVAVRRSVLLECGGFGPFRAGADLECWARLALRHPVALSNRVTCLYFRNTGGVMEQFENAPRVAPPLRTLDDISPSVKLLAGALRSGQHDQRSHSIEAYINSRVFAAARGALYRREIDRARSAVALSVGRVTPKLRALQLALNMPDAAVLAGLYAYAAGRRTRGLFP